MNRSSYIYLFIFIALSSLVGIAYLVISNNYENDKSKYFYDDSLIVLEGDSYTYLDKLGNIENLTFKGFSGTETIFSASENMIISLSCEYEISKGEFKVVLINENNEILIIENLSTITLNVNKGSRIKIVGANSNGEIKLIINEVE